jgi:hypothetical protein
MPKALSGEMLTEPVVLTGRPQHHSFNSRVKACGAQSARFRRNSLRHTRVPAFLLELTGGKFYEGLEGGARLRKSC